MDQSKTGYLIPELVNGAFGGADDVRHGIGTCEDVLSCSVKTICTRPPDPEPFSSGPVALQPRTGGRRGPKPGLGLGHPGSAAAVHPHRGDPLFQLLNRKLYCL